MTTLDVRCFCARKPLLAACGRDVASGEPYVHIKHVKNGRPLVEVVSRSGAVSVRCRECGRWHTIRLRWVPSRDSAIQVVEEAPPPTIRV